MLGWVLEVLFRRFFSAKKWVNPGFNKGPWLPLYGFGVILMFTMCYLCVSFFPSEYIFYNPLGNLFGRSGVSGATPLDLIPIILMWISMVLLEFVAGVIFIRGFHVKLWDYSNMKGNILGVICPVFTLIWGSVAIIYYYGINPFLYQLANEMHVYMFGGEGEVAHFGFIFALGLVYGIFIIDFVSSLNLFNSISKFAKEKGIIAKADELRSNWSKVNKTTKQKIYEFLPNALKEVIENSQQSKVGESIKQKIDEAILIDPSLAKDTSKNYDENGRPIKIEEDK